MPVTSSAKKALRRDEHRRQVNSKIRARLRAAIKNFEASKKPADIPKLYSVIDRAAKKNIIHANKAARLKSRFSRMVKAGETEKTAKKNNSKSSKKSAKKAST